MSRLAPLLLLAAVPAAADPAPMSAAALPAPTTSAEISLAREDLIIVVDRKAAAVTAVLELENRGGAQRLDVGFPCDSGADPGVAGLDCKTKLAVRADGKAVPARLKKKHWVWPMRFAAGQKVKLEVSYRSVLRNDRYQTPYLGMGTLYYRLATGARWAGPIGELNMKVEIPTDAIIHIAPAGYTRAHGTISWKLQGYEPGDDLAIPVHPMLLGRYDAAARKGDRAALAKVAAELRSKGDEMVRYADWFQEVARGKLGLPAPKEAEVRACVEESARLIEAE